MTPRRPRDPNQLAKAIVDIATGQIAENNPDAGKDSAAVTMGRKGGSARAASLTSEQRSAIAKKAADARWKGRK